MSDHKLTVIIDGRDALPVRAIPYVTGWHWLSPVPLVRYLAQDAGPLPACVVRDGKADALPTSDWDNCARVATAGRCDWRRED